MAGETKKLLEALSAKADALNDAVEKWEDAKKSFAAVWSDMIEAYEGAKSEEKKPASAKFKDALYSAAKAYDGTVRTIGVAETGVEIAIDNLRKHLAKRKNKEKVKEIEINLKSMEADIKW